MDRKKRLDGVVVATAGEILGEDEDKAFERDSATDDTRVRTAVAWLEETALLTREENRVQVFPSSLRVNSIQEGACQAPKGLHPRCLPPPTAVHHCDADRGGRGRGHFHR